MLQTPAKIPARYSAFAALLDGAMVNSNALAARWNTSAQTLANWRAMGRGLPYVILPEGSIRYRVREILDAEIWGTRGPLSVERVALELSLMPEVSEPVAAAIVARLRAAMTGG